jgi:hypothetical protein
MKLSLNFVFPKSALIIGHHPNVANPLREPTEVVLFPLRLQLLRISSNDDPLRPNNAGVQTVLKRQLLSK